LIDLFWFNVRHLEGRQQKHKQPQITKNKTIGKRNPPAVVMMVSKPEVTHVERWSVEQNDWITTCVILKTREEKQDN
jgi:hypothetical protein